MKEVDSKDPAGAGVGMGSRSNAGQRPSEGAAKGARLRSKSSSRVLEAGSDSGIVPYGFSRFYRFTFNLIFFPATEFIPSRTIILQGVQLVSSNFSKNSGSS